MDIAVIPPVLRPLVDYLDQLRTRPPLDELIVRLHESRVTLDDVKDYVRFQAKDFCSSLVVETRWYRMEVRCWRSGQRSPIADHGCSAGVFKVLAGICHVTIYDFAPNGQMLPWHPSPQPAGAVVACQDESLRRISNLQPLGQDLVTLHVYTPPGKSSTGSTLLPAVVAAVTAVKDDDGEASFFTD